MGAETNWASGAPPQGGEEEDGWTEPAYCPPAARRGVKEFRVPTVTTAQPGLPEPPLGPPVPTAHPHPA